MYSGCANRNHLLTEYFLFVNFLKADQYSDHHLPVLLIFFSFFILFSWPTSSLQDVLAMLSCLAFASL